MKKFLLALLVLSTLVLAVEEDASPTPSPVGDATAKVVEKETDFSFIYLGVVTLLIGFAALYDRDKN